MREQITVAVEPWTDALYEQELKPLAQAHFEEVDGGVEDRRRMKLDLAIMRAMAAAGVLHVLIARRAGRMVGYFTWNVTPDVESEGLLIAQQGAWYVAPGNARAAVRLFDRSVVHLRQLGVQCVFPHHRTQGRGAGLGRFFRRRGAKEIQRTFCFWIGEG